MDPKKLFPEDYRSPQLKKRSKVMALDAAIQKFVKPGMTLHIATIHYRPNAAVHQLARQFWGRNPGFTIISVGMTMSNFVLVYGGLAKKVISTFCGDSYPAALPSPVYQEAHRKGTCEFETWSILALPLRLRAGAMGMEWMPCRSVFGSSMEEENKRDLRRVKVPGGEEIGMVRALRPDISFVHAQAADPLGNTLLTPPYGEGIYGSLASKNGIIVTAEKIVPPEFMKDHSNLVRIPGHVVRAVCPVELGAHPAGLSNQGIPELEAYADDYDFLFEIRRVYKDPKDLRDWVHYWVLDVKDQQDYLSRLGRERVLYLKGKADPDSWVSDFRALGAGEKPNAPPNRLEIMAALAGRAIEERVRKNKYDTILAGIGTSNLGAWLAAQSLQKGGYPIELMAEIGFYGYSPRPSDPFIFNFRNMPTCRMLSYIDEIMGLFMGGSSGHCIGSLGAGQVDRFGNINSTKIPERKLFLTGPGGGNDVASNAREVVVSAPLGKNRCVPDVGYITSPGLRVTTVVCDKGIFRKDLGKKELVLTEYVEWPKGLKKEQAVREIREKSGMKVKASPNLKKVAAPTKKDIWLLRTFDPLRQFIG